MDKTAETQEYLKVAFNGIGEKTFANPGAFEGGFIRKA